MKVKRHLLFFFLALALASGAAAQSLTIVHVTVIDTIGGSALPDHTVTIRDGRITAVEPTTAIPDDALDGRGKFLIPGLWDMHVHLSGAKERALPLLVANGVTGVRDLGSRLREIDEWRTRIDAGLLVGPRMFRAGPILNGEAFNRYQLAVGSAEESRGIVRALKQVEVDFIKVHRRTPREAYFAIVDEAKKQGLAVVGHIPMTVTPEEASDAGQATIEHVVTLFEGTFSANLKQDELLPAIRRFRERDAATLFARFAKNGTVLDPTLVFYKSSKQLVPELIALTHLAHEAHVALLAGTDLNEGGEPGASLHEELAFLVDAGLTPLEALQTATVIPARVLQRGRDFGAIRAGAIADLVLLDANPLDDIHNTRRIAKVIVGGKVVAPPRL